MVSSRPALSLKPNEFAVLENVRNRYGIIEARKSEATWAMTGFTGTPVFYGSWNGTISGTEYAVVVVKSSTVCQILQSTDGAAFTSLGTFLTDSYASANGIAFCPVNDPVVGEQVLISDGNGVVAWKPGTVTAISAQTNPSTGQLFVTQSFPRTIDITDAISNSGSDTGTTFLYSEAAGAYRGLSQPYITISATQVDGDTVTWVTPGMSSTGTIYQLGVFVSVPDTNYDVFSSCKFEIFDGSSWTTVYDPTGASTSYNPPSVEAFESYAGLTDSAGATKDCLLYTYNLSGLSNVGQLRWTYKGGATQFPAGEIYFLAVVGGGSSVPGVPNYKVSNRSSVTGVESAGIVVDSANVVGATLAELTGVGFITARFPLSYNLRANWSINGAYNLYRKDAGSTQYLFAVSSASSPTLDTVSELGLNPERPAPSAFCVQPPAFTSAISANGRTIIASGREYKFSEYGQPMRFGLAIDPDNFDRSSGGYKFASENPKAFAYLPGDANIDRFMVITDRATYAINGIDAYAMLRPSRVSQYGTPAGKSAVTRRERTYFLDDARQLRVIPGQSNMDALSWQVKDILDGISSTYVGKCIGATFDDRYYLFYPASDQTANRNALVFDIISGTLSRDTFGTAGIVATFQIAGKFIALFSDGTAKRLEEGSSTVTVTLTTRELGTVGNSWASNRHRVYGDSAAAKSLTLSWVNYKDGATITDTISIAPDSTEPRIDKFTDASKAARGRSIQFGLTGTVPSGWKLYGWEIETEGRSSEGDV